MKRGSARGEPVDGAIRARRLTIRARRLTVALAATAAFLVVPGAASAAPGYTTQTGTGTIVPGTTDIGNHVDDGVTPISFPFPVTLYRQTFTTANADSNGSLLFSTSTSGFNANCPLPDSQRGEAIMAFQRDFTTTTAG